LCCEENSSAAGLFLNGSVYILNQQRAPVNHFALPWYDVTGRVYCVEEGKKHAPPAQ
jgi:hypothetical protein